MLIVMITPNLKTTCYQVQYLKSLHILQRLRLESNSRIDSTIQVIVNVLYNNNNLGTYTISKTILGKRWNNADRHDLSGL
jgi:hypothetical protein